MKHFNHFSLHKLLLCLLLVLLFIFTLQNFIFAQEKAAKIDEFMTYCYNNGLFNGTVLVAENGNVIYKKAFGFSNFETKEPLQTHSRFHLASFTKQFTTMAIMILKQQGKLKYDDKLSTYFPELAPYANQVTIEHLMTHTSGIRHFRLEACEPDLTNQGVLDILSKEDSLLFKPGEKFSYINTGFVLLSTIVEKASGLLFRDFLKTHIFDPLEMTHSLVYDESKPDIPGRARGYNIFGEKDEFYSLTTGALGIYSTLEDLFKWDQALYTEKLVKAAILNEAFTPYRLNNGNTSDYGYGWMIYEEDETAKRVAHAGEAEGFRNYIERQLDDKNTIILLTNKGDATPWWHIRTALRNILHNKPYEVPKKSIALKLHEIIKESNINEAISQYYVLKENNSDTYDFHEYHLNVLAYQLLWKKRIREAIDIFKLNVEAYPEASNPYDSLGDAYMVNGDMELAIKNYKKSLELNPDNFNAILMLKKIDEKMRSSVKK